MSYTKGPWACSAVSSVVGSLISGANKNIGAAFPQMVKEECEANAALIASAPELLEALEALMRMVPVQERDHPAFAQARTAAAKAKGIAQ